MGILIVLFSFIFFLITYFVSLVTSPWNTIGNRVTSYQVRYLPVIAGLMVTMVWISNNWLIGLVTLFAYGALGFLMAKILKKDFKTVWSLNLYMLIGFLATLVYSLLKT